MGRKVLILLWITTGQMHRAVFGRFAPSFTFYCCFCSQTPDSTHRLINEPCSGLKWVWWSRKSTKTCRQCHSSSVMRKHCRGQVELRLLSFRPELLSRGHFQDIHLVDKSIGSPEHYTNMDLNYITFKSIDLELVPALQNWCPFTENMGYMNAIIKRWIPILLSLCYFWAKQYDSSSLCTYLLCSWIGEFTAYA